MAAARRKTLICCLSTQISASSVARARIRSASIQKISLQRSVITGSVSRFVSVRQLDLVYDRDNHFGPYLLHFFRYFRAGAFFLAPERFFVAVFFLATFLLATFLLVVFLADFFLTAFFFAAFFTFFFFTALFFLAVIFFYVFLPAFFFPV